MVPCSVLYGTRTKGLSAIAQQPFSTWLMTPTKTRPQCWLNILVNSFSPFMEPVEHAEDMVRHPFDICQFIQVASFDHLDSKLRVECGEPLRFARSNAQKASTTRSLLRHQPDRPRSFLGGPSRGAMVGTCVERDTSQAKSHKGPHL